MPKMDGPTLFKEIRKRDIGVEMVFMSGFPKSVLQEKLGETHGYAFVEKPFSPSGLVESIHSALNDKGDQTNGNHESDKQTVMLLHDSTSGKKHIRTLLANGGFAVVEPKDCLDALETICGHHNVRVDILVCELRSSILDGYSLAQELGRRGFFPEFAFFYKGSVSRSVRRFIEKREHLLFREPIKAETVLERIKEKMSEKKLLAE
jgi:DNA-binding NtrC family response regulator